MAFNPAMLAPLLQLINSSGGSGGASTNMMNNAFSSQALTQGAGGGVGGGGAGMGMSMGGPPRVNNQSSNTKDDPLGLKIGARISGVGDALANMPMWETQLQPFTAPYQGPAVGPAGFNPGEAALLTLMQRISAGGR